MKEIGLTLEKTRFLEQLKFIICPTVDMSQVDHGYPYSVGNNVAGLNYFSKMEDEVEERVEDIRFSVLKDTAEVVREKWRKI